MTALVLEPHNDDAALFACFTALREHAHVITVLRSEAQAAYGIDAATRELESGNAMALLGLGWAQWAISDNDPDWGLIERRMAEIALPEYGYTHVYAPAVEDGGHDHHSLVGAIAARVFDDRPVAHYLTYTRHGGKSTGGEIVEAEPWMVRAKLRALACFESQIETAAAGCTEHFLRDQHEYLAAA